MQLLNKDILLPSSLELQSYLLSMSWLPELNDIVLMRFLLSFLEIQNITSGGGVNCLSTTTVFVEKHI